MFTFHYLICDSPKKSNLQDETVNKKYQIKKLIFDDNKLQNSEDNIISKDKLDKLVNSLYPNQYTLIDGNKIDLDSFLKNISLTKVV